MKTSILFVTAAGYQYDYYSFAKYLKEKYKFSVYAFAPTKKQADLALSSNIYDEVICLSNYFPDFFSNKSFLNAEKNVKSFELSHPECLFQTDWDIDRVLRTQNYSYEQFILITDGMIRMIEEIVTKFNIRIVIGEKTMLYERVLHNKMKELNGHAFFPLPAKYFDRIYFDESLNNDWPVFRTTFENFKLAHYKDAINKEVAEMIFNIRHKQFKHVLPKFLPTLSHPSQRLWLQKINPFRIINYIKKLIISIILKNRDPEANSPYHFHFDGKYFLPLFEVLKRDFVNPVKTYRSISHTNIPDGKYVAYFMHLEPEFTIDSLANQYRNQVELIHRVAKKLPVDIKVAVKENPVTLISHPKSRNYYKELTKLPNIYLLRDDVDSHMIIQNSMAVFTLTGTVAIECFLFNKPCFTLGNVFFKYTGITTPVDSIEQLSQSLMHVLLETPKNKDPKENDTLSQTFFQAIFDSSRPGKLWNPVFPDNLNKFVVCEQNNLALEYYLKELSILK